jgi:hypothetical protein
MDRPTLSALIVARDEADSLPACLDALSWADEIIVVVDARSRDATESIARARADRTIVREFDTFSNQRNAALDAATGDWVLAVDADERVTTASAREIRRTLDQADAAHQGFRVRIHSTVFGRRFRFSGTQLDRPLRLFRRPVGRWQGTVHETVRIDGKIGLLRAPIEHTTHETLREFFTKLNDYTDLEAAGLHARGASPRPFDITLRPLWTFARLYFLRRGFLDGPEGFLFCALSAVSVATRNWKLREYWRSSTANAPAARKQRHRHARISAHSRAAP